MRTKIEWCDFTWNPIIGCTKVSAGCDNCYAERMAGRFYQKGEYYNGIVLPMTIPRKSMWTGKTVLKEHKLDEPLRWRKPRLIFVCSMGDLFHESVPDEWIDKVMATIARSPHHRFMVLTKRPKRMLNYLTSDATIHLFVRITGDQIYSLPNLALGVSVEDQPTTNKRIPILLQTPADYRFVSLEPALGLVDFRSIGKNTAYTIDALRGTVRSNDPITLNPEPPAKTSKLDLVIIGGESGPNARPMHPEWARSVRDQCEVAGVPFHFKQWGEWAPVHDLRHDEPGIKGKQWCNFDPENSVCRVGKKKAGRLLDGREHNGMIKTL